MSGRPARRWVTPEGARLELAWLEQTSRNRGGRDLRDGGTSDGWRLVAEHPNGAVLCEVYFGATVPEAELAKALAAINAVPVLG